MSAQSRRAILRRISSALGSAERKTPEALAREAAELVANPARYQPKFDDQTNRQRFIARATSERLTATVDEVASLVDAPAAVQRYLERAALPLSIARPPMADLETLDWGRIETHETLSPDEPVVVNRADYAIAETGTLVFTSRPDSPTLFNFWPLHHVILIDGHRILRYAEDYSSAIAGKAPPRSLNFITGTSGTADIEAQNIRGAHGPRFMHIIIIGADQPASG